MSWTINEKEIESVLRLEAPTRYSYCVKRVADWQGLYSLKNDAGWAVAMDDAGIQLIPVWPHEAFAWLCVKGAWQGYSPQAIPIDVWLTRWVPGSARDGRLIAVFPTPQNLGIAVDPADFARDLRTELAKYE